MTLIEKIVKKYTDWKISRKVKYIKKHSKELWEIIYITNEGNNNLITFTDKNECEKNYISFLNNKDAFPWVTMNHVFENEEVRFVSKETVVTF